VDRQTVVDCIRLASYAPNASNAQEWHWVVVDDPDLLARVGEQYRRCTVPVVTQMLAAKETAGDEAGARISRSIIYLGERMAEVPMIVIPCYDLAAGSARYGRLIGPERDTGEMEPGMYASIYPAVWSFLLALRSRGLGSALTTAHQSDEAAMAEILGIPTTWVQTALIPVAHTTGGDFVPSPRAPVEGSIVWNEFAG
jgi:nitroreductase